MSIPTISLVNCENKVNRVRGNVIHRVRHELEAALLFLATPTASNIKDAMYLIETLRNEIENRDAGLLDYVTDLATEAIAARFGSGQVTAKVRAHIVAAVR